MKQLGWTICLYDECAYWKQQGDLIAIAIVQVDKVLSLVIGRKRSVKNFGKHFEIVDNGRIKYFMAMRFHEAQGLV
jgi:hypothetical protein